MSHLTLPFTVQDDLEAKEKKDAIQQQKRNKKCRQCNSRRVRIWTLMITAFLITLFIVNKYGDTLYYRFFDENDLIIEENMIMPEEKNKELTLKEEILKRIHTNPIVMFSKTYCPYSKKAKRILNEYNLKKQALDIVEVNLRDDDFQVKMVLKEISGIDTFPNIFLNGDSLGGSDDLEILHESGQLKELLDKNQLLSNLNDY
ncbi:thioredoxin-like protein [Cokeromyces recurvatus]|uniref:thioredoxin-like protein n=1 Tax=Cokeromyces recurvatus TaxID=90255 RepID=UPI00221EF291|nr:thioredoxin-like protein [Cokeromyces recurvatus]KAI7901337.1 thioredoxin-like protein [Cokeromyces recurvatus]